VKYVLLNYEFINKILYLFQHLLSIIERVGDAVPRGLDSRVIRQLPTKSFSMSEVKEGESSPECNICICEYVEGDRLRILQCLHRFHTKCIDKWLSVSIIFIASIFCILHYMIIMSLSGCV